MGIKINKVYTKTGDSGETGLVGGQRISKTSARIETVGAIDELNSLLGLCKEVIGNNSYKLAEIVEFIQQELFDIGSEVSTPSDFTYEQKWETSKENIENLERFCDNLGEGLPELTSFILPGGSELVARLHLARAACRKAERRCFTLSENDTINENIAVYLNRLSDFLFIEDLL